jgi:hypothetical protein
MSNTVFAIVKLQYSQSANIRGLDKVFFQITNSRTKPGDCISDYLQSTRYGAALSSTEVDSTSLTALNAYSDGKILHIHVPPAAVQEQKRDSGLMGC